jgi:hypothetical protein
MTPHSGHSCLSPPNNSYRYKSQNSQFNSLAFLSLNSRPARRTAGFLTTGHPFS